MNVNVEAFTRRLSSQTDDSKRFHAAIAHQSHKHTSTQPITRLVGQPLAARRLAQGPFDVSTGDRIFRQAPSAGADWMTNSGSILIQK